MTQQDEQGLPPSIGAAFEDLPHLWPNVISNIDLLRKTDQNDIITDIKQWR